MIKQISIMSMALLLVACGGSGSEGYAQQNQAASAPAPALGSAQPDAVDTKSLEVDKSFAFATARTVDIEFDIATARNDEATVTICTDYEPVGEEFDINFDSCTISGELDFGKFNHSMEVTNDNESVVAVVLFQDSELVPMYKEFNVDSNQRTKRDGTSRSVIVWR